MHVWIFQLVCSTFRPIYKTSVSYTVRSLCSSLTNLVIRLACSLYRRPITPRIRVSSASRGPSCVFICWTNFQAFYWSTSNCTGQATGSCGMVNELQIAQWTIYSAGLMHIYYVQSAFSVCFYLISIWLFTVWILFKIHTYMHLKKFLLENIY